MKYSRYRIALLTFILGIVSVSFFNAEYNILTKIPVDLPKVESDRPFICDIYPTKRLPMQYSGVGGSGASGGQTCDDFIKSLGKLTKQSRRILAYTPCSKDIPKE